MRIAMILVFYLFAFPCLAEINKAFHLSSTESVFVDLYDDAKNGCWTNLRETREYAEEKLRAKGANIIQEQTYLEDHYIFAVGVMAYRTGTGNCVAAIDVDLKTIAFLKNTNGDDVFHFASVGSRGYIISGYNKANSNVLDTVKSFIDELKR